MPRAAPDEEEEEENAFEKADEREFRLAAIEPPNAVLPAAVAVALVLGPSSLAAAPSPKLLRNQEEGERELAAEATTRDLSSHDAALLLDENAPISFLSLACSDACSAQHST